MKKRLPDVEVIDVPTLRPIGGGDGRARLPDGRIVKTPPEVRVLRVPIPPKLTAIIDD
jgi:hypothetical protein